MKIVRDLIFRKYTRADGVEMSIAKCLIDSGWQAETVYRFCQETGLGDIIKPSKGIFIGATSRPLSDRKRKPGEQLGLNWRY